MATPSLTDAAIGTQTGRPQRRPRASLTLCVAIALLAGCDSDSPASTTAATVTAETSEDEFLDEVDRICATAARQVDRLAPDHADAPGAFKDILNDVRDQFDELDVPRSIRNDFDDLTDNLDEQIRASGNLELAANGTNVDDRAAAAGQLDELASAASVLARNMRAVRCASLSISLGWSVAFPATTTANTTIGTDGTDGTQESTVISADATTTVPTVAPATFVASAAADIFDPPQRYHWDTSLDPTDEVTPADDPVLGPLLFDYAVGVLLSDIDDTRAKVFVTTLNTAEGVAWTDEQLEAYFAFEFVDDGVDTTTTPSGFPARLRLGWLEDTDAAVIYVNGVGVLMLVDTGVDVLGLLDAFGQAQAMGG